MPSAADPRSARDSGVGLGRSLSETILDHIEEELLEEDLLGEEIDDSWEETTSVEVAAVVVSEEEDAEKTTMMPLSKILELCEKCANPEYDHGKKGESE